MYIFVINPQAGNGRGQRLFTQLQKTSTYQKINAHFIYTQYKGHAREIAEELSHSTIQIETIIIVGGDGTIYEFLNGFTNRSIPLSFLLGGSGNDFARACHIDGSSEEILKRIISQEKTVTYWPSTYQLAHEKHLFVNSIGFGFDALIAKKTNQSSAKSNFNKLGLGRLSYIYSLIKGLIRFKPLNIKINVSGLEREINNCWIASASNHPYVGGGMKLTPQAKNNPDEVTLILIHSISRLKVLLLFSTVYFGFHTHLKEVEQINTEQVTFSFENEIDLQVDGETEQAKSCTISKENKSIFIRGVHFSKEEN